MRRTSSFLFVIYTALISWLGISGLGTITRVSAAEPPARAQCRLEVSGLRRPGRQPRWQTGYLFRRMVVRGTVLEASSSPRSANDSRAVRRLFKSTDGRQRRWLVGHRQRELPQPVTLLGRTSRPGPWHMDQACNRRAGGDGNRTTGRH